MRFNPYEAPRAQGYSHFSGAQGEPEPWSIGEVFQLAWELYKQNWGPLTAGLFLTAMLSNIPSQTPNLLVALGVARDTSDIRHITIPCMVIGWIASAYFSAGFVRATTGMLRTGTMRFADIFSAGSRFLPYLALTALSSICILLGMIAFIVPGVILALGVSLARYYVVDQRLGPIDAMRTSWNATVGHKANIFLFYLVGTLLLLGGLMACCVGVIVAQTVIVVAESILYMRLAGVAQGTHASVLGVGQVPVNYPPPYGGPGPGPGFGPPGAGYGPPGA